MEIHDVALKFGGNEADLASNLSGGIQSAALWRIDKNFRPFSAQGFERLIDQTVDVRRASSLSPGHQIGSPTLLPTRPLQDAH